MRYLVGSILDIKVTPNAKRNEIVDKEELIRVYVTASPEDGKANKAVEKLFKKTKGVRIEILSGHLSRIKRIKLLD